MNKKIARLLKISQYRNSCEELMLTFQFWKKKFCISQDFVVLQKKYCKESILIFAQMMILFQSPGPWYLKTNFPVSGRGKEESELQCGELVPNFKV